MADINKLKIVKKAHLSHVTRALNSLTTALAEGEPVVNNVKKYLKIVIEKYDTVLSDSAQIQSLLEEEEDITKEIEDMYELEETVIDVRCNAEQFLEEHSGGAKVKEDTALNDTLTLVTTLVEQIEKDKREENDRRRQAEEEFLHSRQQHLTPKLPELQIEKFNGDLEKYQEFIDSFTATIDQNPKLEEIDKFRYLRMYVEDSRRGDGPKSLIAGFSTTAGNYQEALNLIKVTYGKKERIIMSHVSKLLNLEGKESLDKGSLRILFNKVKTHVRSLQVLGVNAEQYSIFLVPIVLSKLTHSLRKEWGKCKKDDDIVTLLEFIEEEIRSLEEARQVENAFTPEREHRPARKPLENRNNIYRPPGRSNYSPSTATALHASSGTAQKWCAYCQNRDHTTQTCGKLERCTSLEVRNFLTSQRLCFCCMKKGHSLMQCHQRSTLFCEKCKAKNHHTFLHEDRPQPQRNNTASQQKPSQTADMKDAENKTGINLSTVSTSSPITKVLFQTANAYLTDEAHQRHKVKVVFDPCSDHSYVTTAASSNVNLRSHEETLEIKGYNGRSEGFKVYKVRHAVIESITRPNTRRSVNLVETDRICASIHREAIPHDFLECQYLRGLDLAEDYSSSSEDEIDVLIGLDFYWDLVTGRIRRKKDKPVVVESILGWMLQATSSCGLTPSHQPQSTSLFITASEGKELNEQLKKFWEIEEIGSNGLVKWTEEETLVHNKFKECLTYEANGEEGKYQVKLPIRDDIEKLGSNKVGAVNRYNGLKRRLDKHTSLGQQYTGVMTEYIESGFLEKLDNSKESEGGFYLPHHPVVKEDKATTKVRPVFDASASDSHSRSLNSCLFKGPTLQPQLNAIMMRFRMNPIAFTSDVMKMFLMIQIHPDHRNWLKVVWDDLLDGSQAVYRYTVLPFGLRCSPYLAIATIHHHVSQYADTYPHVVKEILENMYVDDLLSGAKTVEEALRSYEAEVEIMKAAGMKLRKWSSNNPVLAQRFKDDNVSAPEGQKDFSLEEDKNPNTNSSVLGIRWNSSEDYFTFHEQGILDKAISVRPTKRNILSVASKLYDPPGWLSPFIIKIKILIQIMWQRGFEWDEILPPDILVKWDDWKNELQSLSKVRIPRYIGSIHKQYAHPVELHTFGDASEEAYAAVSYLKSVDEDGIAYITLMYSKTRVSPIKLVSLPRLELLASVLAAEAATYVINSLKIRDLQLYMWTDAKVALQWIRGSSRQYKTFVGNRVEKIHGLTDPGVWRWCPGEQNPADIPSRGCSLTQLAENEFWWNGPAWLKESPEEYPNSKEDMHSSDVVKKEIKPKYSAVLMVSLSTDTYIPFQNAATKLIDPKRYSKLKDLLITTAYINRYLHNLSNKKENRIGGPLVAKEIHDAQIQWLQCIQRHCFPDDINLLQEGKNVKKTSRILKLAPFYDEKDKLIKMGGRIEFSNLSEEEKHPVILPSKSYIVKLIVEDTHRRQLHAGINQTLISLRDKYWIVRARQVVRSVVKSCFICRKLNPVRLQVQTSPLPRDRITQSTPFEVVGIDFTGPVYVYEGAPKEKFDPELRRKVLSYDEIPCNKMYICLYTCAVTRAVHLELVWSLTTEAFIRSFRRFISARGMCRVIYSDNAKTFERADKDLQFYLELMQDKAFQSFLTEHSIQWKYILECSPWWGGFYERLMKTIKKPLKKILGKSRMDVDEMSTLLKEVEAQVNSRPLCTPSDEPSEQNYLTPASFLIGRPTMNMPLKPRLTTKLRFPQRELNKLLKQQVRYLDRIWRTWKEEYLRGLGTVSNKVTDTACVKVGELVMVANQNLPRTVWEVGVVTNLKESKDGRIRTVYLNTPKGPIARSVQHLSRLEADSIEDYSQYPC